MGQGIRKVRLPWELQIAVIAAYAATYEFIRSISFSHWIVLAGLRLTCLLLLPRRFWLAIGIGETSTAIPNALHCIEDFGALYAVFAALPIILPCMPIIRRIKSRMGLFGADGSVNMPAILVAALVCALVTAVINDLGYIAAVYHATNVGGGVLSLRPAWFLFSVYVLGAYLGALTLTPCILAFRERAQAFGSRVTVESIWRSRLFREVTFGTIPLLLISALLCAAAEGSDLMMLRLSMVVPVVVLTLRHGWHGGAIAGMLASISMAATSTIVRDPAMIQAQTILAIVTSTSLLVGVRFIRSVPASALRPPRVVRW